MIILLTLATALAEEPAPNPWSLQPVLQVRPRLELDTARDGAPDTGGWSVSQRSRFGVAADGPRVAARVVVQDVRVWGTETDTLKDPVADAIDFHEAWARLRPVEGVALTVGRQEIAWNEQRLVGAVDWAQQGRAFDAAKLSLARGAWSADLAGAVLFEGRSTGTGEDEDNLAILARGGWKTTADGPPGVMDLVSVTERDVAADQLRETAGLYLAGGTGALSGRLEGYAQVGYLGDATYRAWMAGVQATLAPDVAAKPSFTLWFDNLSGDDDLADETLTAFQAPFGTNHKFYGIMDVACFTTACWVDGRGLRDAALKLAATPIGSVKVNLDLHAFLAAADQGGEPGIGQEIDLWAHAPLAKAVTLSGGMAVLARPDLDPDLWGYLALDVAP